MAMIKTVLENNVFEFEEYIQTEGVAIGSKLGRNVARTYMRRPKARRPQYFGHKHI